MSKGSSAPAATPVDQQVSDQEAADKSTGLFNFALNNPNTYSPLGSSTYTYAGTDANGNPTYNNNISLSPQEQTLFNQQTSNQAQEGQVAGQALQGVANNFSQPYDLNSAVGGMTASQADLTGDLNNTYNALYNQQTAYLDPQYQEQNNQLQASLANQGLVPGSAAYNNAMADQGRTQTFGYQQAADQAQAGAGAEQSRLANLGLQNQAQAAQLYTQQYQEPLNLYSALSSGSQASLPSFNATSTNNQSAPNVLGAYANNYNGELNAYNAQTGSANSTMSGLTGLAGTLGKVGLTAYLG